MGDPLEIHDFIDHHGAILDFRGHNLNTEHQREAGRRSAEARRARNGTAQPNRHPEQNAEPIPEPVPEPVPEPHGSEPMPNRSRRTVPEPTDRTGPDRTEHMSEPTGSTAERGFATTPTSPPPKPPEPPGLGRSPRLDPGLPEQAVDAASDAATAPAAELGSIARGLELRIMTSYVQALKHVQVLAGYGMTPAEIRAAINATPAGKQAPWAWAEQAHRKHRDATTGHIA